MVRFVEAAELPAGDYIAIRKVEEGFEVVSRVTLRGDDSFAGTQQCMTTKFGSLIGAMSVARSLAERNEINLVQEVGFEDQPPKSEFPKAEASKAIPR